MFQHLVACSMNFFNNMLSLLPDTPTSPLKQDQQRENVTAIQSPAASDTPASNTPPFKSE